MSIIQIIGEAMAAPLPTNPSSMRALVRVEVSADERLFYPSWICWGIARNHGPDGAWCVMRAYRTATKARAAYEATQYP